MSRIGKQPIKIENNVQASIEKGGSFNHLTVRVKGPKGELTCDIRKGVNVEVKDGEIVLTRENDSKKNRSLHGLYRSLIANMVQGVQKEFIKELEIVGVGFRANVQGNKLELSLGLTHPVVLEVPEGLNVEVKDNTELKVYGINKEKVGKFAAIIRQTRKPEPYKGKGIRYKDEHVRRKAGKAAAASE